MNKVKVIAVICIVILVLNLAFFAFGLVDYRVFLVVLVLGALVAYKGIPMLK